MTDDNEIETTAPADKPPQVTGDDPFGVSTETTVPQSDEDAPKNDEVPDDEPKP
jgi:hypothetical protein